MGNACQHFPCTTLDGDVIDITRSKLASKLPYSPLSKTRKKLILSQNQRVVTFHDSYTCHRSRRDFAHGDIRHISQTRRSFCHPPNSPAFASRPSYGRWIISTATRASSLLSRLYISFQRHWQFPCATISVRICMKSAGISISFSSLWTTFPFSLFLFRTLFSFSLILLLLLLLWYYIVTRLLGTLLSSLLYGYKMRGHVTRTNLTCFN